MHHFGHKLLVFLNVILHLCGKSFDRKKNNSWSIEKTNIQQVLKYAETTKMVVVNLKVKKVGLFMQMKKAGVVQNPYMMQRLLSMMEVFSEKIIYIESQM
jgi:hypothetical protein